MAATSDQSINGPRQFPISSVILQVGPTSADAASDSFEIPGNGIVTAAITLADTNSADGDFFFDYADDHAGTFDSSATTPTVTKTAGTALSGGRMTKAQPGASVARIRYERDSGGDAAEDATIVVTCWAPS